MTTSKVGAASAAFKMLRQRSPSRRGVSLAEVLVVVAILGLLIALILPAINSARQSARRTECVNKMKQVALAAINTREKYGATVPANVSASHLPSAISESLEGESRFVADFSGDVSLRIGKSLGPVWFCPDDADLRPHQGEFSYLLNGNLGGWEPNDRGSVEQTVNNWHRFIRADWPDGRSNTAFLGERLAIVSAQELFGSGGPVPRLSETFDARRIYWYTDIDLSVGKNDSSSAKALFESFVDKCTGERLGANPYVDGEHRYEGGLQSGRDGYDHILPPNAAACVPYTPNAYAMGATDDEMKSAAPASSRHTGGVNLALADGGVRFVAETIDSQTWRALGSAESADIVSTF